MQIGVIGLGRMGGNISRRLMKAGHHSCSMPTPSRARRAGLFTQPGVISGRHRVPMLDVRISPCQQSKFTPTAQGLLRATSGRYCRLHDGGSSHQCGHLGRNCLGPEGP
jgi:NAD binding domain of 6-phosphogluconate dehydrogenase